MTTTPFRLLALCLSTAAASRPRDDAATATCLADPSATCDLKTPCAAGSFTRACLDSWVPFRTAHDRATCCLDCCLQFFVKKYGLDANAARAQRVVPELASAKAFEILVVGRAQPRGYLTLRARDASRSARTPGWVSTRRPWGPNFPKMPRARVCVRRPPRHRIETLERAAHGHARLP